MISLIMWNPKYDTNKLIYEGETDSQTVRTNRWWPGDGGGGQRGRSGSLEVSDASCLV